MSAPDTTTQDIYAQQAGQTRRTLARRRMIDLQLRLTTLLEPKDLGQDGIDYYWSERKWIEADIARMAEVVKEPIV